MFVEMWQALKLSMSKLKVMRYALGFAGVSAAIAISSYFLHGHLSMLGGIIVAVNIGIMLMLAVLMASAAAKAKQGTEQRRYGHLYFSLAWVFSSLVAVSALLSIASVFFHWPLDFREPTVEAVYSGDYRVEQTVMLMDLRHRIATEGHPGAISKDIKYRFDRIVKQRETTTPYTVQWGTNGSSIEGIESSTHPGMTTRKEESAIFGATTKHTYISSVPADEIPFNHPTDLKTQAVFVNGFSNEAEEWVGACPNFDTESLTMILLCPESKPCHDAVARELPTGSPDIPFRGRTTPVTYDGGKMVTWTIVKPTKGVGYYIDFKW